MRMDIAYRIMRRNQLLRLRVRFRSESGQSAVREYSTIAEFLELANRLGTKQITLLHEDVNVVSQLKDGTYYRVGLEINPEDLRKLGVPNFGDPQGFDLSFSRVRGDRVDPISYQLKAKEWGVLDRISLEITQVFSKEELTERLGRVGLQPSEVRDQELPGSGGRKINEDEVELLFDPTKPDDVESLGLSFDTQRS